MSFETPDIQQEVKKNRENSSEKFKSIYRGIWADELEDKQQLPMGGSLFSKELTTKLELDFSSFDYELSGFTEENLKKIYKQSEDSVKEWLRKINSNIDPYLFFLLFQAQKKVHKLLEINLETPTNSFERRKMYQNNNIPKLSQLKGKSECVERAVLGQYILQKSGIKSSYVSGITMNNPKDDDEYPEDHSFIVLSDPTNKAKTLIFDIARPKSGAEIPRLLETDAPLTYDLLKDKEDLLVGATEVLQRGRLWFGVGDPTAGYHEIIEKPN